MTEADKIKLFNTVYLENKELIFRLCQAFLGHSAEVEDLFQEIFLKVWNNLESFKGDSKISTWIYRIGTNTALLYRKRKARRGEREKSLDNLPSVASSEQHQLDRARIDQQFQQLLSLIAKLEDVDRIIITMVLEGFSYKEIAEVSGLKISNVGVKINRIKNRIRKKISIS